MKTMPPDWQHSALRAGDNMDITLGINCDSVDLIYLDPPFNSNRTYSAPIGSEAAGATFKDTLTLADVDDAWHCEIADREPSVYTTIGTAGITNGKGMKSYLIMMAVRPLEMRRELKGSGSVRLHCDPTASLLEVVDAWGVWEEQLQECNLVVLQRASCAQATPTVSRTRHCVVVLTRGSVDFQCRRDTPTLCSVKPRT